MTYNPFSLAGKNVLITGASSGIGRSTAVECSRMGARVCITGRDQERLGETYAMLEGDGHVQIMADLTCEKQIEELVARLPMLDGVVHSAGINLYMRARDISMEDIHETMDINLSSVLILNKELITRKRLNKGISFVFISSVLHRLNHRIGYTLYSASKAALVSVSGVLAIELQDLGCRSNVVSPAMVETPLLASTPAEYLENDRAGYPMGYGKPEDVAWMCVYLLSEAARWVSRSEFEIHGGSQ